MFKLADVLCLRVEQAFISLERVSQLTQSVFVMHFLLSIFFSLWNYTLGYAWIPQEHRGASDSG
jgi:hypothetical protein